MGPPAASPPVPAPVLVAPPGEIPSRGASPIGISPAGDRRRRRLRPRRAALCATAAGGTVGATTISSAAVAAAAAAAAAARGGDVPIKCWPFAAGVRSAAAVITALLPEDDEVATTTGLHVVAEPGTAQLGCKGASTWEASRAAKTGDREEAPAVKKSGAEAAGADGRDLGVIDISVMRDALFLLPVVSGGARAAA
mmetsp:Transcript_982/g.2476  ORF Transcript_982/g.2476 Transcript_982/m.2476 type:complete len:196 (-) Transcript_982:580-1167(-)